MVDHNRRPNILTDKLFRRGLSILTRKDRDFARVLAEFGPPPMWQRTPGFPTLVHIILEQQVSLASAGAALGKLKQAVSPLTPQNFLQQDDKALRAYGFSRQKREYCRHLAALIIDGRLALKTLYFKTDKQVRRDLMAVRGIGPWTADIYLLMALRRPDIWPSGDLALASAMQNLKKLPFRPSPDEMNALAVKWKPWRAVAARILWHYYLSNHRGVKPSQKNPSMGQTN